MEASGGGGVKTTPPQLSGRPLLQQSFVARRAIGVDDGNVTIAKTSGPTQRKYARLRGVAAHNRNIQVRHGTSDKQLIVLAQNSADRHFFAGA